MAFNVLAINISMGGLLLGAAPSLPVGSACRVSISLSGNGIGRQVSARGTVIRSDDTGTAIRFERAFDEALCAKIVSRQSAGLGRSLLSAYLTYFAVSQAKDHAGCETLLGVSKSTFRHVFLTTFSSCIVLAVVPVWLLRHDLLPMANWIKVSISFFYALLWIALLQPMTDLIVLKYLKNKKLRPQKV
jgi:hypothetical protein